MNPFDTLIDRVSACRETLLPTHLRDDVIAAVLEFQVLHGVGASYVGVNALGDSHFPARTAVGRLGGRRALKVLRWMADFTGVNHNRRTCEKGFFERVKLGCEMRPGPLSTECWNWTGKVNARGYPIAYRNGKSSQVHREVCEIFHGDMTELVADHICRNRVCVNPDHIQPVTNRQNVQLGFVRAGIGHVVSDDHCIHGHEMTEENTVVHGGRRICRQCSVEKSRIIAAKRKEERARGGRALPIDDPSAGGSLPGSWEDALKYSVNIRVVNHNVDGVADGECQNHGA